MNASSSESIVSSSKDFVIKLRLVGSDGHPEIRRVRLSRISDEEGKVSYDELLKVVVAFASPNLIQSEQSHYQVVMTYYDVDNDCVTIASTEELVDAIEQFYPSESKVLRVTTDVKLMSSAPSRGCTGNSAEDSSTNGKAVQLQGVLESFLSVLTVTVDAVQKQIVQVKTPSETRAATAHVTPVTTSSSSNPESTTTAAPPMNQDSNKETTRGVADDSTTTDETQDGAKEEASKPFIHGRHTCDTCLVTPIVGKRWHATNRQDYDLCDKCHANYKGTDIQFETAELDRDRGFQARWQRKREVFERRVCRPHGRCGHRANARQRRYGNQFRWTQPDQVDADTKEAIRRSLEDCEPKPEPKAPEPPVPEPSAPEPSAPETPTPEPPVPEPSAPVEGVTTVMVNNAEAVPPVEPNVDATSEEEQGEEGPSDYKISTPPQESNTSFASDAVGNGETAETIGVTLDNVAQAIDDMVSELTMRDDQVTEGSDDEKDGDDEKMSGEIKFASSETSEDEWHVVSDGEQIGDDQVISDEMLARATQLIGSALFESDIRTNESNPNHALDGSAEAFSLTSSLPTLSSNVEISGSVLARWDVQLTQLHELGFCNDAQSVEILERLTAANIGVDCNDEISVTQVVNEILASTN